MRFFLPSRMSGAARLALAALAIVAILGLATPTASANASLEYGVVAGTGPATISNPFSGSATGTTNSIGWTITAAATDSTSGSSLHTTTINLSNSTSSTETITIGVAGLGYTMAGTAALGVNVTESSSLQGTAGPPWNGAKDSASGYSVIAGNTLATQAATVTGSGPGTSTYTVSPSSVNTSGTLPGSSFSIVQQLTVTLGAGDSSSFTFTSGTTPIAVPEPSTMAIAGLGALGMIGYGLRRRKALGA